MDQESKPAKPANYMRTAVIFAAVLLVIAVLLGLLLGVARWPL